jgi:hypothetical protein
MADGGSPLHDVKIPRQLTPRPEPGLFQSSVRGLGTVALEHQGVYKMALTRFLDTMVLRVCVGNPDSLLRHLRPTWTDRAVEMGTL